MRWMFPGPGLPVQSREGWGRFPQKLACPEASVMTDSLLLNPAAWTLHRRASRRHGVCVTPSWALSYL